MSLPSGAAAAQKAMKNNYEWLQQFEKIILFFDNDEAGRKATKDAADAIVAACDDDKPIKAIQLFIKFFGSTIEVNDKLNMQNI